MFAPQATTAPFDTAANVSLPGFLTNTNETTDPLAPWGTANPGVIDVNSPPPPGDFMNLPVLNNIDVGVEGISAVIMMMILHGVVLGAMFAYGVPLNGIVNIMVFLYLLCMVVFYGGLVAAYYLDWQIPPVILTTILPYMYTLTLVILLIIATFMVHPKMPFDPKKGRGRVGKIDQGKGGKLGGSNDTLNQNAGEKSVQRKDGPNQNDSNVNDDANSMDDKLDEPNNTANQNASANLQQQVVNAANQFEDNRIQ